MWRSAQDALWLPQMGHAEFGRVTPSELAYGSGCSIAALPDRAASHRCTRGTIWLRQCRQQT